jgi:hypothetical protein
MRHGPRSRGERSSKESSTHCRFARLSWRAGTRCRSHPANVHVDGRLPANWLTRWVSAAGRRLPLASE